MANATTTIVTPNLASEAKTAAANPSPFAGEGGGRRPPDEGSLALSSEPPGEPPGPPPPTIVVERVGPDVRLLIEAQGESFAVTLDRSAARDLAHALIAAAGSGFHRTYGG